MPRSRLAQFDIEYTTFAFEPSTEVDCPGHAPWLIRDNRFDVLCRRFDFNRFPVQTRAHRQRVIQVRLEPIRQSPPEQHRFADHVRERPALPYFVVEEPIVDEAFSREDSRDAEIFVLLAVEVPMIQRARDHFCLGVRAVSAMTSSERSILNRIRASTHKTCVRGDGSGCLLSSRKFRSPSSRLRSCSVIPI